MAPQRYESTSTATCAKGLAGVYCTLCAAGKQRHYFEASRRRCEPCNNAPLALLEGLVGGIGGSVIGLLLVSQWLRVRHPTTWTAITKRGLDMHRWASSVRPAAKIIFGFYQIIAVIGEVYDVTFPPAYKTVLNIFQFATFKLTAWLPSLPLQCAFPSLRDQLLIVNLVPLGVLAAAAAAGCASVLVTGPRPPLTVTSLLLPSLPFILGWSFVVLPPVSSLGFRALAPCEVNL